MFCKTQRKEIVMKISDSEMEIMNILWENGGEMISPSIAEKLEIGWKTTTILTFLKRLEKKGAVNIRRENRINYYRACLTHEEYLHEQTEEFIREMHKGSVKNFLAALYGEKKPNDTELSEIKEWFESL